MPEQHVREARGRVQQDLLHQLLRRYRVLATARSARLRPPAGMAKAVPATLLLRLYGIDRVARVCFVIFTEYGAGTVSDRSLGSCSISKGTFSGLISTSWSTMEERHRRNVHRFC